MLTVSAILHIKGHDVVCIENTSTVLQALQLMAEKDIGALIVTEKGQPAGIFSERDFARTVAQNKTLNLEMPVDSLITREVFCCSPDQTIDEVMAIMTRQRIRHLPVKESGKLAGIISIGDVVKNMIEDKELLIQSMEKYICGQGYGE